MILVTGAAGKTGKAVINALARRGAATRALVRRETQAAAVNALGARQVTMGDMADRSVLRQALSGVRAVYLVCPNMHQEEELIGRLAIAAAREAGVKHFVYHSVMHPQTEKMPHHWHKLRVEEALFESGFNYTILQPAAYMQNVLAGRESMINEGIYRVPYPVETKISMVDLEDVAEAAAVVLTEPGHAGAVYELAGPEALAQTEVAAMISKTTGCPVRAAQVSPQLWRRQAVASGLGKYQVETLLKMFDYYARYGFWGNGNVLRWLLKRAPAGFAAFAEREFAVYRPSTDHQ
ncbi:MAG: NmrA family NAD(P)-binding protein [Bacillota bacterium]